MLLTIPVLSWTGTEEFGSWENDEMDINPICIESVMASKERKNHIVVTMQSGEDLFVRMNRLQFKKLLKDYMEENVLSRIYKQIKDSNN